VTKIIDFPERVSNFISNRNEFRM